MNTKIPHLLLTTLLLTGCDHAIDCIDDDGPVFNQKTLTPPILNQVYENQISVSIRNEPLDDQYRYDFSYTGTLPNGISTRSAGRIFQFEGTPTELGAFEIEVFVQVGGDNLFNEILADDSGLCFTTQRQKYILDVQEEM